MWFLQIVGWICSFFSYASGRPFSQPITYTNRNHAQIIPWISGVSRVLQASPAQRSAASTTLRSSMARVIGPTPPGLGVYAPATS